MKIFAPVSLYALLSISSANGFVNKGAFTASLRNTFQTTTSLADSSEYFSVETSNKGPAGGKVHTLTIHKLPGQGANDAEPIVIETGKIARQAAGSVTLTRGSTTLLATSSRDESPKDGLDFLPLSVDHQERFSSAGTTSGSYNRRDGRPAEHEILTCRLIDRPLRPLIADGWRHETQLLSWVISYDGKRSCDPLAIVASSAALYLSDIPLTKAVAAVMVGYNQENDEFMLNPTHEQMATSQLQLIVAGTKEFVLMVEGAAEFLPESVMVQAVKFGHENIGVICDAVEELAKLVSVEKKMDTLVEPPAGLQERVNELMTEKVDSMFAAGGTKTTQSPVQKALKKELIQIFQEENEEYTSNDIGNAFKELLCRRMFERAKATGKRCDGRELDEIRHLDMEAGFLPSVHGSALFTRGETQCLATATLGGSGMKQKIDKLDGLEEKRFYLQYSFVSEQTPHCVKPQSFANVCLLHTVLSHQVVWGKQVALGLLVGVKSGMEISQNGEYNFRMIICFVSIF